MTPEPVNYSFCRLAGSAREPYSRRSSGAASNPGALTVVPTMVEMPNLQARYGTFLVGYKTMTIRPFTAEQLIAGYHVGNVSFGGYANRAAYDQAFTNAVQSLLAEGLYDPAIAGVFMGGDPGAIGPTFP